MSDSTLYPAIVLIPQWLIDNIATFTPVTEPLMTDKMRTAGWTPEMLAGGIMFARCVKDSIESMPDEPT